MAGGDVGGSVVRVHQVLERIPYRQRFACWRVKRAFLRYMRARLGHFFVEVDPAPPATSELVAKTCLLRPEEAARKADPDYYLLGGYHELLNWFIRLERCQFNLRTIQAVLDFGCGSARLIRHLRCVAGIRLIGSDLDAASIAWCQANVPGVEFHVNGPRPPLDFAADDSIDLVMASSVFTHIPLEIQDEWIQEIRRVLRPGGFLVCTVHGTYHEHEMLSAEDRKRLRERGRFTLQPSDPGTSYSSRVSALCDVFQTRHEVLRAFGRNLRVCDYAPGLQDLLILQKS